MGGVTAENETNPDRNMNNGMWNEPMMEGRTDSDLLKENMYTWPKTTRKIAKPFIRSI